MSTLLLKPDAVTLATRESATGTATGTGTGTGTGGTGTGTTGTATNQIAGTTGPDNLAGTNQSDSISALAGNDAINARLGDDFVDGGAGDDAALFAGVRKSYTFAGGPGPRATVSGQEGSDTYNNVEHFRFIDGEIVTTANSTAGQVYRVYGATLDRAPDPAGLRFWTDQLDAGVPLQQMVSGFTGSPEFSSKYGASLSNLEFVNLLYLNVLDRPGDGAGTQFWVNGLNAGSANRSQVVLGFSESTENIDKSQTEIDKGLFVGDTQAGIAARVYYSTLDRAPDTAGLKFWTDSLNAGTPVNAMVDGFTGSPEFTSKYGTLDNGAFVDLLYLNVLDRASEPAGKASWVNALNSGAAKRADVVLGFSESQEHILKVSPVIEDGIVVG